MSEPTSHEKITAFQNIVWNYYKANGRHDLPWRQPTSRGKIDPYHILVSELMLQQTQVVRVIPKFNAFLRLFPTVESLANASLSQVLTLWSGLGYNRRAKFLHLAARKVVAECDGIIPYNSDDLESLPGVGPNTAAAILAYSFNAPVTFIETNIRTVYIHHFFLDHEAVTDKQLIPIIEASLDPTDSRQWYWALMDYGSYLKSVTLNPSRKSSHHIVQSKFEGSRRQIRGKILKMLMQQPYTKQDLIASINDSRLISVLDDLIKESLISQVGGTYILGK